MDLDVYEVLGARIREFREEKNWTQNDLGEKVDLTRSSITNIESGRQKIQLITLYQIAFVLEVEISSLLPSIKEFNNEEKESLNIVLDRSLYGDEELEWLKKVIIKGKLVD